MVLTGGTEPLDIDLAINEIFSTADFGYASAAIEVVKTGSRVVLLEPDGNVAYTITTRNTGYLDLTLTTLEDDQFGNLAGQGSCRLPIALPARSSIACEFSRSISGSAGSAHTNIVTATAADSDNNEVSADDNFTVRFIGINFGYFYDDGVPPIQPPPEQIVESIPATPRWALALLVVVFLGLGVYARKRRAASQ